MADPLLTALALAATTLNNALAARAAGTHPTNSLQEVAGLLTRQRRRTLHLIVTSLDPEASHG
jgi:hypothetical protein